MTALEDSVTEFAPMMQGRVSDEMFIVWERASMIAGHAGPTVLPFHPRGSLEADTSARPEVWADGQQVAELAENLKTCADAVADAAPNRRRSAAPVTGVAGLAGTARTIDGSTAMAPAAPALRGFTEAEVMGDADPAEEMQAMRKRAGSEVGAADLTPLAADDRFQRSLATCSARSFWFRAGPM